MDGRGCDTSGTGAGSGERGNVLVLSPVGEERGALSKGMVGDERIRYVEYRRVDAEMGRDGVLTKKGKVREQVEVERLGL